MYAHLRIFASFLCLILICRCFVVVVVVVVHAIIVLLSLMYRLFGCVGGCLLQAVHDLFLLLLALIAVIARCYMLFVVVLALLWKLIDFMLFAFVVVGVVAN